MDDALKYREKFIGFPFFIFISILLGIFGILTTRATWLAGSAGTAILSALLIGIHIGLYWLNLRTFSNRRWWMFYYFAQTVLIISLAFLPHGANFLGTAIICIIAEALGLWGNTRRALAAGVLYTLLMTGLFGFLLDQRVFLETFTHIMINGGFIILLMLIFNQQLAQRQKAEDMAETLESANAKLAAYAARNEALTLQAERERMARELHDTLAQGVAGLILQLEALKAHQQQKNYTQAEAVLQQAIARARNTLSESRAAIENLRNDKVNFKTAVEIMIEQYKNISEIDCQLTLHLNHERPIPATVQHHALRVLHEALANISKHAGGALAEIRIEQNAATLALHINDNGKGFDTNQPYKQGRFGLQGLAERAQLTDSQYTLTSKPNEGTTIEFVFPLTGKFI